jgi:hypothetical protein
VSEQLPELQRAGTIEIQNGVLVTADWFWDDDRVPAGRSVKELHEASHGAGCTCPVNGFGFDTGHIVLRYDEPAPYAPEFWRQIRRQ